MAAVVTAAVTGCVELRDRRRMRSLSPLSHFVWLPVLPHLDRLDGWFGEIGGTRYRPTRIPCVIALLSAADAIHVTRGCTKEPTHSG